MTVSSLIGGCFGAFVLGLASCQSVPALKEPPKAIHEAMVGTWQEKEERGHLEATMIKTFYADGTADGWIQDQWSFRRTTVHPPRINFTSRWRIEGDVVVVYDIHSNREGLFKPTEVLRDRVLRIAPEQMDFFDLIRREHFSLVRMHGGEQRR